MNDFEDLFSGLLGGTLADTFGGGRRFLVTLRGGRMIPDVGGIYEPRHVAVEVGDSGAEFLVPFPRIQLRRDHLKAAGVTDLQSELAGAMVLIDGETVVLDSIRDDGWTFVDARILGANVPPPDAPVAPPKKTQSGLL